MGDPIGTDKEGNEITLIDVMGTSATEVSDEVELRIQVQKLWDMIERCLTTREKLVIELRYGLGQRACIPQREVAKLLNISRSYVSRIEKKALSKLQKEFERL